MASLTIPNSRDAVQSVRRFNRFYTRQIGALQEHLLNSRFSLTEVRVLYELAHCDRVTAVDLARQLGLDRGYLSRMLQNFEKQGWVKTAVSSQDRRRTFLSLTSGGRKVFHPLDRESSEEVAAMLARITPRKQRQMLAAMRDIEGVLGGELRCAAPFSLRQHRPGDMGWVVCRHGELYWQEYRYDERFEALVAGIVAEFVEKLDPNHERCWIAEQDGERLGSIFLVQKDRTVAKLRLLLVEPSARGRGVGRRLVAECIEFARKAGYRKVMLWTQSELHAARHLYEDAGFRKTAEEPHQSWGRNDLIAETWELEL